MNLNPDDPRLTDYALGEMPEEDRAAFEAELLQSPECREIVEEIRQTAGLLKTELAGEPAPELRPKQRDELAQELTPANVVSLPRTRWYTAAGLSAMAACLALVIAWQAGFFASPKQPTQVVLSETPVQLIDPTPTLSPVPDLSGDASTQPTPTPTQPPSAREFASVADPLAIVPPAIAPAPAPASAPEVTVLVPSTTPSPAVASRGGSAMPATEPLMMDDLQQVTPGATLGVSLAIVPESSPAPATVTGYGATTVTMPPSQPTLNYSMESTLSDAPSRPRSAASSAPGGGIRYQVADPATGVIPGERVPTQLQQEVAANRTGETRHWYDGYVSERELERDSDKGLTTLGTWRNRVETAAYPRYVENSFLTVLSEPLSTFSIDVDTASYANIRRFLNSNRMPPRDAIRIEEMVNYFTYDYPQPRGDAPFAAHIEVAGCPWNSENRLVRVGLKGREIARGQRPPSNFVFLIDVSGSMQPAERLPLIKQALRQLVKRMTETDRVAIVVYASKAGVHLPSTSCANKERILRAIDELEAGGSTNGGDGIQQAYRVADENLIREGVNRVLLCTDGDFNVGMTDQSELVRMIQRKARSGVFLTTLGVGTDNYKDALMQKLADSGNGNYHYLDTLEEAQKVLIEQMNGTLVTIAKDVKIQIEFNPAQIGAYRLIGYEKRMLRTQDFNNDAKDAGEIGAGHTVTALYEVVPAGRPVRGAVDDLKYQRSATEERPERYVTTGSRELLTLKVRYKQPDGDTSRLLEFPVTDGGRGFNRASDDFKFAAAVASFGMLLRDSEFKGNASYGSVLEIAEASKGTDAEGYRAEFLNLVRKARELRR